MNAHDSEKVVGTLRRRGLPAGRHAGGRRAGALQHLQHSRQSRTEGFQPAAEVQARRQEGQDLRRARLRGAAGRREDLRARAARQPGGRFGQLHEAAARCWSNSKRQPPRHRPEPRYRRDLRHAVHPPRQSAPRLPHDHRRLRQIVRLLRGAVHPRTGAQPHQRKRHARDQRAGRAGLHRSPAARPEREQLSRSFARRLGLRHPARARRRSSRHPPRALHHLPSARFRARRSSTRWTSNPALCDHVHLPVQSGSSACSRACSGSTRATNTCAASSG